MTLRGAGYGTSSIILEPVEKYVHEPRKGNSSNAMNGLNYFLLQLKGCMMEASWWQERGPMSIGDPISATRVGLVT